MAKLQDNKSEGKKHGAIPSAVFCIIYLIFVAVIAVYTYMRYRDGGIETREIYRYQFGFMLAVLLGLGDSFHLIPRVLVWLKGSLWNEQMFLGIGNLISSITMTIFYNILIKMGDSIELSDAFYNLNIERLILLFTEIRIIILLLPMNRWFSEDGSRPWAVIRNIPFVVIGILTVIGFINVIRNSYIMPTGFYLNMIVTVIFSFVFYLPVAIDGKKHPVLGVLMIPKTLCYMWMMVVIAFWH